MLFLLTFLLVSSEVSIVRSNIQEINACFDSNVPATIDKSFVCFRQPHKCKINLAGTTLLSSTGSELGESLIIAIGTKEQLILSASSFRGETQTGPPTQSQIPDAPTKVQEAYSGKTLNDINIIVSPGNTLEIHNSEVCFDEQEADCKIYLSAGAGLSLSNAKLGERLTIISDGCLTAFSAYRSIVLSPIITTGEPVKIKTHKFEKSNKLLKEKFSSNGFVTSLTERGVIIEIPGKFFEFDSPRLLPKGEKLVKNLAPLLRSIHGRALTIEGHTDKRNDEIHSIEISSKRAERVKRKLGLRKSINTVGVGSANPRYKKSSILSAKLNNRIEIIIENFR